MKLKGSSFTKMEILSLVIGITTFTTTILSMFSGDSQVIFLFDSQEKTVGKVFWNRVGQDFNEEMSQEFTIINGIPQTYKIDLSEDLDEIGNIRIDPGAVENNTVAISYLMVKRPGFTPVFLALENLQPARGVRILGISNRLRLVTTSISPIMIINIDSTASHYDWTLVFFYLVVSVLISAIIWNLKSFSGKAERTYLSLTVSICLAIVFSLCLSVAITADFNASPDERDHFMAAEYFKSNSITPQEGSALGLYTYNGLWAYSRVYQLGMHYFLAGKFSNFFDKVLPSFKSVRLLSVFLILFLLFLSLIFPNRAILLVPFLLTPQVWYIFSYVNDDYFPLFISFLLVMVTENYREILQNPRFNSMNVLVIGMIGALLGSLFLAKENYLVFVGAYIIYLFTLSIDFSKGIESVFRISRSTISSFFIILLLALSFFSVRWLVSNAGAVQEKLTVENVAFMKQAELNKAEHLKPGRSGQARWGSYSKMMKLWVPASYRSFNGVYGFLRFYAPMNYFIALKILHLIWILGILIWMFSRPTIELFALAFIILGTLAALIFASSYLLSYLYYYQPQGRYLFPFMPLLGLFFSRMKGVSEIVYTILILLFTFLGIYSFVFYGLNNL